MTGEVMENAVRIDFFLTYEGYTWGVSNHTKPSGAFGALFRSSYGVIIEDLNLKVGGIRIITFRATTRLQSKSNRCI
jgi:hypothetical protein